MLEVATGSGLFVDTVNKPFDLQELVDCVQHAIDAQATPVPHVPALAPSSGPGTDGL
jgi:hypothetical protein